MARQVAMVPRRAILVICTFSTASLVAAAEISCARICSTLALKASASEGCAKARRSLPRPKIGNICQDAFDEAVMLTCVDACSLSDTGRTPSNRLGEVCNKRKRTVPKPVAHKACVEGYYGGHAATMSLLPQHMPEVEDDAALNLAAGNDANIEHSSDERKRVETPDEEAQPEESRKRESLRQDKDDARHERRDVTFETECKQGVDGAAQEQQSEASGREIYGEAAPETSAGSPSEKDRTARDASTQKEESDTKTQPLGQMALDLPSERMTGEPRAPEDEALTIINTGQSAASKERNEGGDVDGAHARATNIREVTTSDGEPRETGDHDTQSRTFPSPLDALIPAGLGSVAEQEPVPIKDKDTDDEDPVDIATNAIPDAAFAWSREDPAQGDRIKNNGREGASADTPQEEKDAAFRVQPRPKEFAQEAGAGIMETSVDGVEEMNQLPESSMDLADTSSSTAGLSEYLRPGEVHAARESERGADLVSPSVDKVSISS